MRKPKSSLLALSLISALTLSGCVINVGGNGDYHNGGDVSSILGSVTIDPGRHAGDVSSVNGDVRLKEFAVADDVSTVNGSVILDDNVAVNSAATVNGDISAGENLNAFGSLNTVNGTIELSAGSMVEGDIETVNGDITLPDTEVKGDLTTLNGTIKLTGTTRIYGDILFEESDDGWSTSERNWPVLVIEKNATLDGNIILERAVKLQLADKSLESKVIRRNRS